MNTTKQRAEEIVAAGGHTSVQGLEKAFKEHDDIAAVIVEGVQGSGGAIKATSEFLTRIRDYRKQHID